MRVVKHFLYIVALLILLMQASEAQAQCIYSGGWQKG